MTKTKYFSSNFFLNDVKTDIQFSAVNVARKIHLFSSRIGLGEKKMTFF